MDQRTVERYELAVPARIIEIEGDRKEIMKTRTRNISSKGMFISLMPPLPQGKCVEIELLLPVSKLLQMIGENRNVMVRVNGTVVRTESEGMAIKFEKDYQITVLDKHSS